MQLGRKSNYCCTRRMFCADHIRLGCFAWVVCDKLISAEEILIGNAGPGSQLHLQ